MNQTYIRNKKANIPSDKMKQLLDIPHLGFTMGNRTVLFIMSPTSKARNTIIKNTQLVASLYNNYHRNPCNALATWGIDRMGELDNLHVPREWVTKLIN